MTAVVQKVDTLTGELCAWRVLPSGWGFGRLRTKADEVQITGSLVGVRAGDTVEVVGVWENKPPYGLQFKVRTCTVARPESVDGVIAWLSSTLPDIGDGRARALVERFGADLWRIIETKHEALATVDGITPKRAQAIHDAYVEHRADRDNMIVLRGVGLTDNQIARCVAKWKTVAKVVECVRSNPYQLSEHVFGFGFKRADLVARKAGVAHDAPERVRAGVEHVLAEARKAGHCFVAAKALQSMAVDLLGVDPAVIPRAVIAAAAEGGTMRRYGWRIYARQLDRAEQCCADALERLLEGTA